MTDIPLAKVSFGQDTTFLEAAAIAAAIADIGFDVDHLMRPDDDEPHLYVVGRSGGDDESAVELADELEGFLTRAEAGMTDEEVRAVGRAIDYLRGEEASADA